MRGIIRFAAAILASAAAAAAVAGEVGHIKSLKGAVQVEREGQRITPVPGMAVREGDRLLTGPDGAVGVTFTDASLLSAGPRSVLVIDRYRFDSTSHAGEFEASLKKGTLAVVSGRIVKQTPGAMRLRTPASVMGVRGTEFLVSIEEE